MSLVIILMLRSVQGKTLYYKAWRKFATVMSNKTSSPGTVRELHHDVAVVCGVLGIGLNGLILVLLCRRKKLVAEISRRIIINQSIIDTVVSIFLVWAQFHSFTLGSAMPRDVGGSPWLYCNVIWSTYILWGAITASTWNLLLLTVERYLSVCHPVSHRNYCTKIIITVHLILVWIAAYAWQIFAVIFLQYDEKTNRCLLIVPSPEMWFIYMGGYLVHTYWIPIVLMVFCYGRMISALKNRVTGSSQEDSRRAKQNRSFLITCLMISVAYVVCYTLNSSYAFLTSVTSSIPFEPTSLIYTISVILTFTNSFVNPIIYISKMESFRREIKMMLRCGKPSSADSTSQVENTRGQ